MSVLTPKRVILFAAAVLLATTAFANRPSPRFNARMAFDQKNGVGVLFGGRGAFDGATQLFHDSEETWFWTGARWIQHFPVDHPAPRNAQSMVYDTKRERVVLFGGRREATVVKGDPTVYNDLWIWQNENWTNVQTASAPSPRHNAGMAYDIANDRIVLFGGTFFDAELNSKPVYDTWEFDGTNWTQVGATGTPAVSKPELAYDAQRHETLLMGIDGNDLTNVMYRYDSTAKTWTKLTPAAMPPCLNEGHMLFQPNNQKVVWFGGICATGTSALDEVWEWNGVTWTKVTVTNAILRSYAQAVTYDSVRQNVVLYGGTNFGDSAVNASIVTYARGTFHFPFSYSAARPSPRSLFAFHTDPSSGNIWLFGGLNESSSGFLGDFWGYRSQQWYPILATDSPGTCTTPLSAFDTDRNRLIVACDGSAVHEFDSATLTWKTASSSKVPGERRFANMVYDRKLKKAVLFGGYDINAKYLDDTWTWDGTSWVEVKTKDSETPENRGLMAMWYDPLAEKTILYGGIGRPNLNSKITRYSDMWSFDGTRWTKMSVTDTPGRRLGAMLAVHPTSGKVLLFGGLLAEGADQASLTQTYVNDTWEWDGTTSKWTKLAPARSADVRENGMMAWDPGSGEIVLFGGYEYGFYRSDVWSWDGQTWRPLVDKGVRRRTAGSAPPPVPPPTND